MGHGQGAMAEEAMASPYRPPRGAHGAPWGPFAPMDSNPMSQKRGPKFSRPWSSREGGPKLFVQDRVKGQGQSNAIAVILF